MMEKELRKLAGDGPPPSEDARRAALAAAMQAFDRASDGLEQKNAARAQGIALLPRLTHIATSIWSELMRQRLMTGSALATLMLLPAAGYLAWQITQDRFPAGAPLPVTVEMQEREVLPGETRPLQSGVTEEQIILETPAALPDILVNDISPPPAPLRLRKMSGTDGASAVPVPMAEEAAHAGNAAVRSAVEQEPGRLVDAGQDRVKQFSTNAVKSVSEEPVSTFSADVDTASYAMVRRALKQGLLPDPGTVRVEEMINYFPYEYPGPDSLETPFKATVTVTPTPWNQHTQLLHVGVKGYDVAPAERPRANLVFLIDVSGSMSDADKLPLLKSAFGLLVDKLEPEDTVSIVTYAGEAGTVLEPTPVSDKRKILDAMSHLRPGGSTAGAAGIEEAYRLAESGFVKGGVNRVILATDGDFNIGASDDQSLQAMIEAKRESGVFLSVFGFGQGNYNDQLMQALAQNGNGVAAYIDTLAEAEKTLVQEASASLFPIASDVKFQIEFNPAMIAEYRQIGFETRALAREDFNNDRVDAGEIGSGHTVTAIYEITPVGSPAILNSELRYGKQDRSDQPERADELAYLKIRAKTPGQAQSTLTEIPVGKAARVDGFDAAPEDVRFSIAVAAFGQKLRGTDQLASYDYEAIADIASAARGRDPFGYRSEFLQLVRLAKSLDQ